MVHVYDVAATTVAVKEHWVAEYLPLTLVTVYVPPVAVMVYPNTPDAVSAATVGGGVKDIVTDVGDWDRTPPHTTFVLGTPAASVFKTHGVPLGNTPLALIAVIVTW
jgi:hypothetical protein